MFLTRAFQDHVTFYFVQNSDTRLLSNKIGLNINFHWLIYLQLELWQRSMKTRHILKFGCLCIFCSYPCSSTVIFNTQPKSYFWIPYFYMDKEKSGPRSTTIKNMYFSIRSWKSLMCLLLKEKEVHWIRKLNVDNQWGNSNCWWWGKLKKLKKNLFLQSY